MFYTDDPERDYESYMNSLEKENKNEEDYEWTKADRDFDQERDENDEEE